MKILFVSCHQAVYTAHLIPLIVLKRMADKEGHTSAFFLPPFHHARYKEYLNNLQVNLLDVEYDGTLSAYMRVFSSFKPDIIVDDLSYTSGYISQLVSIPRIAIVRTGSFPKYAPRNPRHKHSCLFDPATMLDVSSLGLKNNNTLPEFMMADAHIVPGVPSVEVLPSSIENANTYFFSGPLILDDIYVQDDLREMLTRNADRTRIYVTYGTGQAPHTEIHACMEYLLGQGCAVVTNVENAELVEKFPDRFYFDAYLPMHYVCAHVDLVIHHSGSAAYHYPILHGVPSITIGTQCYDRDDVAVRLEELGVSEHLCSPKEVPDFYEQFVIKVASFLNRDRRIGMSASLEELKQEVVRTASAFSFRQVLETASHRSSIRVTDASVAS